MSVAYGPYWDLRGLSTDVKPLDVPNGTSFYEMDTGNVFMFDGDSKTWLPQ